MYTMTFQYKFDNYLGLQITSSILQRHYSLFPNGWVDTRKWKWRTWTKSDEAENSEKRRAWKADRTNGCWVGWDNMLRITNLALFAIVGMGTNVGWLRSFCAFVSGKQSIWYRKNDIMKGRVARYSGCEVHESKYWINAS